jgi:ApaG protein
MTTSPHSDTTTHDIRIQAAAEYMPQELVSPDAAGDAKSQSRRFVFRYKITMTNLGQVPAKLLSRHWVIVDSESRREDVRGRSVVGEYPRLAPGGSFSYVSHCPLATAWGTMEGSYTFERDDGTRFQVRIGRFFLVPSAPPLTLETPQR